MEHLIFAQSVVGPINLDHGTGQGMGKVHKEWAYRVLAFQCVEARTLVLSWISVLPSAASHLRIRCQKRSNQSSIGEDCGVIHSNHPSQEKHLCSFYEFFGHTRGAQVTLDTSGIPFELPGLFWCERAFYQHRYRGVMVGR
jgi:hypothetical protein